MHIAFRSCWPEFGVTLPASSIEPRRVRECCRLPRLYTGIPVGTQRQTYLRQLRWPPSILNKQTSPLTSIILAVGQNQWYHFWVGAPPILVYFSWDWDVHWGYEHLSHIPSNKTFSASLLDAASQAPSFVTCACSRHRLMARTRVNSFWCMNFTSATRGQSASRRFSREKR